MVTRSLVGCSGIVKEGVLNECLCNSLEVCCILVSSQHPLLNWRVKLKNT